MTDEIKHPTKDVIKYKLIAPGHGLAIIFDKIGEGEYFVRDRDWGVTHDYKAKDIKEALMIFSELSISF
jgi:hypothetical protein